MSALLASLPLPLPAAPALAVVAPDPDALDHAPLLRVLADQRSALIPVAKLPALWGMPADACNEAVIHLMSEGSIEAWDVNGAPGVILSARVARAFGLELVSPEADRRSELVKRDGTATRGGPSRFVWSPIALRRPEYAASLTVTDLGTDQEAAEDLFSPDRQPDPRAVDPLVALVERDEAAAGRWPKWIGWRSPATLVVGSGLQWPEALKESRCPACGGAKLPATVACLPCLDRPEWIMRQKRIAEALDEQRGLIPRGKARGKGKGKGKGKKDRQGSALAGGRGRSPKGQ